jgi:hypothetical protein
MLGGEAAHDFPRLLSMTPNERFSVNELMADQLIWTGNILFL